MGKEHAGKEDEGAAARLRRINGEHEISDHDKNTARLGLYIALGAGLGTALGAGLGAAFGNVALGAAFGPSIGVAVGVALWAATGGAGRE